MLSEQGVLFTQPSASDSTEEAGAKSLRLISLDAGLVSPGPAAQNMDLYAFPGVLCAPAVLAPTYVEIADTSLPGRPRQMDARSRFGTTSGA